ncbi:MAG: hypothetical protein HS116_25060 [Planctomycetes bacterium]|nr:hypothetical protein [Planctomycetota bacterium]
MTEQQRRQLKQVAEELKTQADCLRLHVLQSIDDLLGDQASDGTPVDRVVKGPLARAAARLDRKSKEILSLLGEQ